MHIELYGDIEPYAPFSRENCARVKPSKNRQGAFWQDRYHATAVESDRHLIKCLTYIDLNMVRAGVESELKNGKSVRDEIWTKSIAIRSHAFVAIAKQKLNSSAVGRMIIEKDDAFTLRETQHACNEFVWCARQACLSGWPNGSKGLTLGPV